MTTEKEIPVKRSQRELSSRMSRRKVLQQMLAGAGAAAAWPFIAASHPIHNHLRNAETLRRAEEAFAVAKWTPQFLTTLQNETLLALAEAIVPGSAKAQVHRFIDLLLTVDTPENQQSFLAALAAFDAASVVRFAYPFKTLTVEQQKLLLTAASREETKKESFSRQPPSSLRDHFENLKGWISGAYYSSEAGMSELGWTGDNTVETFPGCAHPESHS